MAEVGVQEPCKSLAGGGSLLSGQGDSGWQPRAEEGRGECPRRSPSAPLPCPDKPGHRGKSQPPEDAAWKELGKKRHRRRPSKKKRRWKPYNKLTWEEKKRLEERESQRASRIRAEMFAKGQPVAPYNTTQFLMDDHDQEEPDLCPPPPRRALASLPALQGDSTEEDDEEDGSGGGGGSDGGSGGGGGEEDDDDGAEFLQKDFSETYEKYHAESLQDMSKQELIREYLELEKCLSRMEDDNNRMRLREDGRIRELEMELERLKEENRRLLRERVAD